MYLKHVITAGILSAALAMGPGAAYAQSAGSTSSSGSQDTTSGTTGSQSTGSQAGSSQGSQSSATSSSSSSDSTASSSGRQAGSSGADQDAVRQHLTAAREALAELTKLPAAGQLQGDQREKVAQFISDFNAFATATTDWRPKYDAVDRSLDQLLGVDAAASASSAAPSASAPADSAAASASDAGASGSVGTSGSAGASGLDPTIEAKLREVRTHLDAFEDASGDPTFVVEKIEKILDQASSGATAGGAVGTSGSGASDGAVMLSASQVQEIRRQLESIKAAAKR